ncbi:MAG: WG repeat-containing protein [Bacteroidota bacterium]
MKHPLATLLLLSLTTHAFAQDILIAVKKDSKWGYINLSETFVIPAKYDEAWPFRDGKAAVVEGTTYGLIDPKGEWIVKAQRGGVVNGDLTNKRFVCSTDQGKWGATDLKGKTVVDFTSDVMSAFQYGMAITGVKTSNPRYCEDQCRRYARQASHHQRQHLSSTQIDHARQKDPRRLRECSRGWRL